MYWRSVSQNGAVCAPSRILYSYDIFHDRDLPDLDGEFGIFLMPRGFIMKLCIQ